MAWYKECNYGTFAEDATYIWLGGYHVGIGPHSSLNFNFIFENSVTLTVQARFCAELLIQTYHCFDHKLYDYCTVHCSVLHFHLTDVTHGSEEKL